MCCSTRGAGLARPCSTARSSFCSVIGFSRKAIAPCLVASTAVSIVPWPLIMMTGIVRQAVALHSLSSVMPSTSGIQMSSSTRSGAHALAQGARLRGVLGHFDGVTFVGQDLRQQGADAEFVVNYKNGGHEPSMRRCLRWQSAAGVLGIGRQFGK